MENESSPAAASSPSPATPTGVSSSGSPSAAASPGSSRLCWASNLSAAATAIFTIIYLGVPLIRAVLSALAEKDLKTAGLSFVMFYMVVRSSGADDIAKVATAAKGLLPGTKS